MNNISGLEMRTKDMDDAQGSYNHGDEIRGLNISLGKCRNKVQWT
jgi:hypothetical protein